MWGKNIPMYFDICLYDIANAGIKRLGKKL